MSSLPEVWRPIPRSDGYEASSFGRIRSVRRTLSDGREAGGQVLKQTPDRDGYPTVRIRGVRGRVNVLVQLAFAGPVEVRHLDGDKQNNRPENLEYGSRWRNRRDRTEEENEGEILNGRGGATLPSLPITRPITLSEAVQLGVVDCSLNALRRCRDRGQLPPHLGLRDMAQLYDAEALRLWDLGRRLWLGNSCSSSSWSWSP